ncbi:hypothetical protein [Paracoccus jeotgali]|uniref:Uncharacterized protein n=1 Tax=Paracoccus jeotgali TaxID=2065379 RepID=A0A2K9MBE7_9RHOB|nr:hypothetical protein [Paracoccus jeotgali]AUM72950.1 hypothetical protein CYR75_00295 [Paracoccus jeotgali]
MDTIREWWGAIMAATGLGVWLIRLEGASKSALREVERLEKQLDADRKAISETRREQNEMLREMRADIKRLLERSSSRRDC